VSLAYQVVGDGEIDLLYVPGGVSNVDIMWESPYYSRFLRQLSSWARLIVMDRRGVGVSERFSPEDVAPLEVMVDDVMTVLDAVGSERAALFAFEDANSMAAMTAASRPERISHLLLLDPSPSWVRNDEITWEWSRSQWDDQILLFRDAWGREELASRTPEVIPSLVGNPRESRWLARFQRLTQTPGAAVAELRKYCDTDLRRILPTIHVPTLIMHREADVVVDERSPRYVADHIPGAKFVTIPGSDHIPFWDHTEELLEEIETFVTGVRRVPMSDRVLATVLFTDIVGSTERQASIGDRDWRTVLESHHATIRDCLQRWRGVEHDTAGDGFYATFDGPARGIECAREITRLVRDIGVEVRAGLHTGECEVVDGKVAGLTVTIGARVAALAGPSQVFVSQTVKDLVAGSGVTFLDAGQHTLKGVPDTWRLYRVDV
jgi:class 3 adenylate cyclase/pimeloyl-ACP methyl ester carboxylesterase